MSGDLATSAASAARRGDLAETRRLLQKHWSENVPKMMAPHQEEPWNAAETSTQIVQVLMQPLGDLLIQATKSPVATEVRRELCGHVFKQREPTYSCRECGADPTCVLCYDCFYHSEHRNHKYRIAQSNGNGYCDCGDREAWRRAHACSLHAAATEDSPSSEKSAERDEDAAQIRLLIRAILHYAVTFVCAKTEKDVPSVYQSLLKAPDTENPVFHTVLFNDETHTYDAVIRALTTSLGCNEPTAMLLATRVDREGRSCVRVGSQDLCRKAKDMIQTRTSRQSHARRDAVTVEPLDVRVLGAPFAAHQQHALELLVWLGQFLETSASHLATLVGEVLLEKIQTAEEDEEQMELDAEDEQNIEENEHWRELESERAGSFATKMLRTDRRLWKSARTAFHHLIKRTVLMQAEQKLEFARLFIECYTALHADFMQDDHDHDASVTSLSVQFLTVPGLARKLLESGALSAVLTTLFKLSQQFVSDPNDESAKFDFQKANAFPAPFKRLLHTMRDAHYLLTHVPTSSDEWTPELLNGFIAGALVFCRFYFRLQGVDWVKRIVGEHQMYEPEWETAFNVHLRLQDVLDCLVRWATSHPLAHERILLHLLQEAETQGPAHMKSGDSKQDYTVASRTVCLAPYDLYESPVSIHQPIFRLLVALFDAPESYLSYIPKKVLRPAPIDDSEAMEEDEDDGRTETQRQIVRLLKRLGTMLYEPLIRIHVLCAQSAAGLWRRNGYALVNQLHNYYSPLCRPEMFDRDVLGVQVGAASTEPDAFLIHVLLRYRLLNWVDEDPEAAAATQGAAGTPRAQDQEELSKTMVAQAVDFLQLLIVVLGERWRPGLGEGVTPDDVLKREVVHILCEGPHTMSQIAKKLSLDALEERPDRIDLEDCVRSVADGRSTGPTAALQFVVHDAQIARLYTPFFVHYSRAVSTTAERYLEARRKTIDARVAAGAPPAELPKWRPYYASVDALLTSPVLIRCIRLTLERAAKKSRFQSEELLHRALYLAVLGVDEQRRRIKAARLAGLPVPTDFDWLTVARQDGLETAARALTAAEAEPQAALHAFLLQNIDELDAELKNPNALASSGAADSSAVGSSSQSPAEEKSADEKARQKAIGAAKRQQAMEKMRRLQESFMAQQQKGKERLAQLEKEAGKQEAQEEMDGAEKSGVASRKRLITRVEDDDDFVAELTDEDASRFSVALGSNRSLVDKGTVRPRKLTCILCQEEQPLVLVAPKDSGEKPTGGERPMVMCAYVQRSSLFSQRLADSSGACLAGIQKAGKVTAPDVEKMGRDDWKRISEDDTLDTSHFEASTLKDGLHVSTCSHALHQECLATFIDTTKTREGARPRQHVVTTRPVDVFAGEFACPLCKRLSNAAVPLLPALQLVENGKIQTAWTKEDAVAAGGGGDKEFGDWIEREVRVLARKKSSLTVKTSSASRKRKPLYLDYREEGDAPEEERREEDEIDDEGNAFDEFDPDDEDLEDDGPNNLIAAVVAAAQIVEGAAPVNALVERIERRLLRPDPARFLRGVIGGGGGGGAQAQEVEKKEQEDESEGSVKITPAPARLYEEATRQFGNTLYTNLPAVVKSATSAAGASTSDDKTSPATVAPSTVSSLRTRICWALAFAARSTAASLRVERKPLFGALNTRQRDGLFALSRLAAVACAVGNEEEEERKVLTKCRDRMMCTMLGVFARTNGEEQESVETKIQDVDVLSTAVCLLMMADSPAEQQHVVRLAMMATVFQVLLETERTKKGDVEMADGDGAEAREEDDNGDDDDEAVLRGVYSSAVFNRDLGRAAGKELAKTVRASLLELCASLSLVAHAVSLVPAPDALRTPEWTIQDDEQTKRTTLQLLARFLGQPTTLRQLLEDSATGAVKDLFQRWSLDATKQRAQSPSLPARHPIHANRLISLPVDFADLIYMASHYKCPSLPFDELSNSTPALCLICGRLLCSQSYCCQRPAPKLGAGGLPIVAAAGGAQGAAAGGAAAAGAGANNQPGDRLLIAAVQVAGTSGGGQQGNAGACTNHVQHCGRTVGMFLRIRDCQLFVLTTRDRGCYKTAPYLDEFGEPDSGFRRGKPLRLSPELYARLEAIWLHGNLGEEVVNQNDVDHRNLGHEWRHY